MYSFLLIFALLPLVTAQFGFFDQMFHGGHSGQQQQQQQHRGGASAWTSQSEAVQCSDYLCPKTLDCVDTPAACPCPSPEDIKCLVGDAQDKTSATVFCARGETECAEIDRLASR